MKKSVAILLFIVMILCVSCAEQEKPLKELPAKWPTRQPIVTPDIVLNGWDSETIESVCLRVSETFDTPDGPLPDRTFEIEKRLLPFFKDMGIEIAEDGDSCDARLVIDVNGEAIKSSYSGGGESMQCYSGYRAAINLTLMSTNNFEEVWDFDQYGEPSATTAGCTTDPKWAGIYLEWEKFLFESFFDIWGEGGYGPLLLHLFEPRLTRLVYEDRELEAFEALDVDDQVFADLIPYFITSMINIHPGIQGKAVWLLGLRPEYSQEAIPYIIRSYHIRFDKEMSDYNLWVALSRISRLGQTAKTDEDELWGMEEWHTWWSDNQPED